MYKTLLAAILSSSIFQLFGQFGVSMGHSRPYSYMGVELKTGISGRLLYLPDFDNGLRARLGVTFAGYKPR